MTRFVLENNAMKRIEYLIDCIVSIEKNEYLCTFWTNKQKARKLLRSRKLLLIPKEK